MTTEPDHPRYSRDFYEWHREGSRASAAVVVPILLELVAPRSVVDVGCGTGTWLAEFVSRGVEDVTGVDGTHVPLDQLEIPRERFVARDFARPFSLERRYDLVLSLEVAEHLPEDSASTFIEVLAGLGDVIAFSAAIPHQGGDDHVNEKWPAWWAERFADEGFSPIDCLRPRIWTNPRVRWWYAQNTILYATPERLESLTNLEAERPRADVPLPLVHPTRYLEWVEWGLEQCRARYEDG